MHISLIQHRLRDELRQNYGKTISSDKLKAAAMSSVVLLFAQVFRLLNGENNPVADICEL